MWTGQSSGTEEHGRAIGVHSVEAQTCVFQTVTLTPSPLNARYFLLAGHLHTGCGTVSEAVEKLCRKEFNCDTEQKPVFTHLHLMQLPTVRSSSFRAERENVRDQLAGLMAANLWSSRWRSRNRIFSRFATTAKTQEHSAIRLRITQLEPLS